LPDIRLNGILTPPIGSNTQQKSTRNEKTGESFSDIFNRELDTGGVKFSKHAQTRLSSRNINLESEDLRKLSDAVDKAASKGITDSLVVMNNVAYIVSIPEKTVITAVPVDEADSNIFTNIDGAVII
jgi:flagellar operon protein